MKAKLIKKWPWNSIVACAGVEFVKSEFRPVPAGREDEAKANIWLETEEDKPVEKVLTGAAKKAAEKKAAKEAAVEKATTKAGELVPDITEKMVELMDDQMPVVEKKR